MKDAAPQAEKINPLDTVEAAAGAVAGTGAGALAYTGLKHLRELRQTDLAKEAGASTIKEARKITDAIKLDLEKAEKNLREVFPKANLFTSKELREIRSTEKNIVEYLARAEKALKLSLVEQTIVAGVAVGTGILVYHLLQPDQDLPPQTVIKTGTVQSQNRTVVYEQPAHQM